MPSLQDECAVPQHIMTAESIDQQCVLPEHMTASLLSFPCYHALYLLPQTLSSILPAMQLWLASRLQRLRVRMDVLRGGNKMVILSSPSSPLPPSASSLLPAQACHVTIDDFSFIASSNDAIAALCDLDIEHFPSALLISSPNISIFSLVAAAADTALHTGTFGHRWQCWATIEHAQKQEFRDSSSLPPISLRFTQFCSSTFPPLVPCHASCPLPLSLALRMDWHYGLVGGLTKKQLLQPRASVFLSRAWGDGTRAFVRRLQRCLEEQLLTCVYVDHDPSDDLFDKDSMRILCGSRIVVIALTPAYLALPHCVRELRWALDLSDRRLVKMLLLPLHPACALKQMPLLLAEGPARGLVYSAQTKTAVRLSDESMRLVTRMVECERSFDVIDCVDMEVWRSDTAASIVADQESSLSLPEAQLTLKSMTERQAASFAAPTSCQCAQAQTWLIDCQAFDTATSDLVDRVQRVMGEWLWRR